MRYFEVARTEMIRSLGMPYSELEDEGIMLPVVQARVDYKAPIFYDELMHIRVMLYDVPTVKLETFYEITTDRLEEPHAVGKVILCFMRENNRKPCRAPEQFIYGLKTAIHS
ncbi:MAG: thioesterase family protein [Balneolaceae bacterium]|nr:thioesterase family protein [Balneolaceae bacterium]